MLAPARALLKRLAPRSPTATRRERLAVGVAMVILLSVVIAVAVHLAWTHSHMRPKLRLTEDLQVDTASSHAARAGLVGYRISAANGQEVKNLDQLNAAIGAGGPRFLLTEAVSVEETGRRTVWFGVEGGAAVRP